MGVEVSRDEAEKRHEERRILHRRRRLDPTEIRNPDPHFRYRLEDVSEDGVANAKAQGMETVSAEDRAQLVYGTHVDGTQRYKRLILMREPIELYEEKTMEDREKLESMIVSKNAETVETLNRLARDEGRGPAHRDLAYDLSHDDPAEIMEVRGKKNLKAR